MGGFEYFILHLSFLMVTFENKHLPFLTRITICRFIHSTALMVILPLFD